MRRRDFLKTMGISTISLAFPALLTAAEKSKNRPNILIVIADDQTWTDCGCYGNKDVKTPNIDKLAAEGMRFTHAFTATAMCSPTRQQLYTGIFPVRSGAYPNHSKVKTGTKSIVHYLKALGYRVGLAGKWHIGPKDSFPFERISKGNLNFSAIEKFITRDKNEPFCLIVASHNPHGPWDKSNLYDPAKLTLPPYLADTPETRSALADYYTEVTALDTEVGKCTELLSKNKLFDNTLFIYTSEQGSGFPHCKWTCYDTGLRVAFIARWPGRIKAGSIANAMIQYVDVVPTLIEAADAQPIKPLDGRSFLPVLLGKTDKHNDVVYGVHTTRGIISGTKTGYPIRSIRTKKYKYIINLNHKAAFENVVTAREGRYWKSWLEKAKTDPKAANLVKAYQHRPAEEFYDILEDPYELNNLASNPANRSLMDSLRKRLEAWMAQQVDRGMETEMAAGAKRTNKNNRKRKK